MQSHALPISKARNGQQFYLPTAGDMVNAPEFGREARRPAPEAKCSPRMNAQL